ncbi:hypothetical protein MIND_00311100 [Mycena indigotica]|uniref:ER membrane protein complex subunit 1 n=1 Tax=Mycena indigotica TaxID=2126181 RepID=A0A8H6T0F5_9AGAR|nr:uncharacterized protein MIND_00311100 [Mycena indigotica]KAF7309403.1 hypothetical protein MIND_00311100 [Mycena indigotica]
MFLFLFVVLLCGPLSLAIQEADVGVIDWHTRLVGKPLAPPVFHHVGSESVIVVPTASNVLAALNTSDGSIVWRYVFDQADGLVNVRVDSDFVAALSGVGGSTLRIFETSTGAITREQRLKTPEGSPTGIDVAQNKFVLNSRSITRVGEGEWIWDAPENQGPYSKLVHTDASLFAVGHNTDTFGLHLASIDPQTGSTIQTAFKHLAPRISSFIVVADLAVWIEPVVQSLEFLQLIPSLQSSIRVEKELKWMAVVDVDLQKQGLFVGVLANGDAKVLKVKEGGVIEAVHTFPANDGPQSIFSGGLDNQGNAFIARLWTTIDSRTRVEIYSPAQNLVQSTFLVNPHRQGTVTHLGIDRTRLAITTSTGSIQLWDNEQLLWTREEGLASIDVAALVELPLPERIAHVAANESFISRLLRQISDTKDFPAYAAAFAQRFVGGVEDAVATTVDAPLIRDSYGFRQVLVVATAYGSAFGIDTANGAIIWTRVFGLGWAGADVGGSVQPLKIFVLSGEGEKKDAVIVALRKADNGLVDTVVFRIDPLTGQSITPVEKDTEQLLQGEDLIRGPLVAAFPLPSSDVILLIDEYFQVNPYPATEASDKLVAKVASKMFLPFLQSFQDGPRVVGHGLKLDEKLSDKYLAYRTWGLNLPRGEIVTRLIRPQVGPVVSYGKVLGNRTTLYKYLNPRMFVVLTQSTDTAPEPGCGLYVVDGVKGSVLYSVALPANGEAVCDVQATFTENWLVYHYYDGEGMGTGQTKTWKIVTVELYEGGLDEKTRSSDMSAFSEDLLQVEPLEQSYIYPHQVTAMTTTSTKFGITTKNVIVATQNNKVHEIPRRMLNPRRPKDRKPTAEEQQEEHLLPYELLMPDDPRRTISHQYEVARVRNIITAPALLESTSLVFSYGLDLFFTRVAPSSTFDVLSKSFNKAQLVLTVFGLGLGIAITRPMVRRKRLRESLTTHA